MNFTDKTTAGSGENKDMLEMLKTFFNGVYVAVQQIGVKIEILTDRINEILPKVENNRQKLEELTKVKPLIETNHVVTAETAKKAEALEHKIGNILDHVTANYLKVEEILKSINPFHLSVENRQEKFEEYAKEILNETTDIKDKLTSNPCLLKDKEVFISGIIGDKVDKCKNCGNVELKEQLKSKDNLIDILVKTIIGIASIVTVTAMYLLGKYVILGK